MKNRNLLVFSVLGVGFFALLLFSSRFWDVAVVLFGMCLLIVLSLSYSVFLLIRGNKLYGLCGICIFFLFSILFLANLIVVTPSLYGVYWDRIDYGTDTYVGVNLDAGVYKFVLNNRFLGIFRDYGCVCEVFAGPYRDVDWEKTGSENFVVYIDGRSYTWSIESVNFDNGCLDCSYE